MSAQTISEDLQKGIRLSLVSDTRAQELIALLRQIPAVSGDDSTFTSETLVLNSGGTTASLGGAGTQFEGNGSIVGYVKVSETDVSILELKAPTGNILSLDTNADSTFTVAGNLTVSGNSSLNQDLQTTSSPEFAGVTLTGFTGILKSVAGVVSGSATTTDLPEGTNLYYTNTRADARIAAAVGVSVQAFGEVLDDLNTLGAAASDGQFIVATGVGAFAYESGATVRTSLGLGTADSPEFAGLKITTAPTNGFVLTSDANGNATWQAANLTPAGADSQVQFNNAGAFGADANYFWNNTDKTLGVATQGVTFPVKARVAARMDTGVGINRAYIAYNASNVVNDSTPLLAMYMDDANNNPQEYATLVARVRSNTVGSVSGAISFWIKENGSLTERLMIDERGWMGLGYNVVSPNAPTALLHVQLPTAAGASYAAKIGGAGSSTPAFSVLDNDLVTISNYSNSSLLSNAKLVIGGTTNAAIRFGRTTTGVGIAVSPTSMSFSVNAGATSKIQLLNDGGIGMILYPNDASNHTVFESALRSIDYKIGASSAVGDGHTFYTKDLANTTNLRRFTIENRADLVGAYFSDITGLGINVSAFGTSAKGVLGIGNGIAPTTSPADMIQIYSKDSSDGAVNATLALHLEQAVEAIGTFTPSHKLKIWVNGVEYWVQLDAV